jgi:hypothetical protein
VVLNVAGPEFDNYRPSSDFVDEPSNTKAWKFYDML